MLPAVYYSDNFERIVKIFLKFRYPELLVFDKDNNLIGTINSKNILKLFLKKKIDIRNSSVSFFLTKNYNFFINVDDNYYTYFDILKNFSSFNVSIKEFLQNDYIEFSINDSFKKVLRRAIDSKTPILISEERKAYASFFPEEICMYAILNLDKIFSKQKDEKEKQKLKGVMAKKENVISFKNILNLSNVIRSDFTLARCIKLMISKKTLTLVTNNKEILTSKKIIEKFQYES